MIFSEETWISGSQPDGVTGRSEKISETLKALGVPETMRTARELPQAHVDHAIDEASQRFLEELNFADPMFLSQKSNQTSSLLPEQKTLLNGIDDWFIEAADPSTCESRLVELHELAVAAKAGGWPVLMILRNDLLREAVLGRIQSGQLMPSGLKEFSIRMRFFINQEIATLGDHSLSYAPSAARSKLISDNAAIVLKRVNKAISNATAGFEPVSIDLPPVAIALVNRSKGDPMGVISEALKLRESAKTFREHCAELVKNISRSADDEQRGRHKLTLFLRECEELLVDAMNGRHQHSIADSLEFDFLGLGFIPNPMKLMSWLKHKQKFRRITALIDLSHSVVDSESSDRAYRKLLQRVTQYSRNT